MRLTDFIRRVYRRFFVTPNRKILWQITDKLDRMQKASAALSQSIASSEKKNEESLEYSRAELQSALLELADKVRELSDNQRDSDQSLHEKLADFDNRSEKHFSEFRNKIEKVISEYNAVTERLFSELNARTEKDVSEAAARIETQLTKLAEIMRRQFQATLINGREIERLQLRRHDSPPKTSNYLLSYLSTT